MQAAKEELLWLLHNSRKPRRRSIREFAEQEVVLPDGKYESQRFRCDRQPFTLLWFGGIDSAEANGWRRFVALGPRQSGKTLCGWVIPIMYFGIEFGETLIGGVPTGEMVGDKWQENLRPAIRSSRYSSLLPSTGKGSKGGDIDSIVLENQATLKFMTGGGGDKSRAGFTSRILCVTETDDFDKSGGESHEADKLTQMEHCTDSYADAAIIFLECTVTIETGRTWREYEAGTRSSIKLMCPYCQHWVTPEREHLRGWQDAESIQDARATAHFVCPNEECSHAWTDDDRVVANQGCRLAHRGQSIEPGQEGKVIGDPPKTNTFGFRWTATNNLFMTAGDIAEREWKAARDPDPENAEKEMRQFVWTLPYEAPAVDISKISVQGIQQTAGDMPRGRVPATTPFLVSAIDLGKWKLHWTTSAFEPTGSMHVVSYGMIAVASDQFAEEKAVLIALREFRDMCETGWLGPNGEVIRPGCALVDAAGGENIVSAAYAFIDESKTSSVPFFATKGYGIGQHRASNYLQPAEINERVKFIGDGYHVSRLDREPPIHQVHVNDDFWKGWLHARIRTPHDTNGTFWLHAGGGRDHLSFAQHLSSEQLVEEWDPKKGRVLYWVSKGRTNHWLDSSKLTCVGAHMLGVRVVKGNRKPTAPAPAPKPQSDWLGNSKGWL